MLLLPAPEEYDPSDCDTCSKSFKGWDKWVVNCVSGSAILCYHCLCWNLKHSKGQYKILQYYRR